MINMLATLFTHPVDMTSHNVWLIIPLSIMVAAVYRTIRTIHVDRLAARIAKLSVLVLLSEAGLIVAAWLILKFFI